MEIIRNKESSICVVTKMVTGVKRSWLAVAVLRGGGAQQSGQLMKPKLRSIMNRRIVGLSDLLKI